MNHNIKISIIIVNWNSGDLLENCIDSISKSELGLEKIEVIVVDNNSVDNSLSKLDKFSYLKIIRNNVNKGFAKACNQGASISSGEYLLFLNPDTVLMSDTLGKCLDFLSKNENEKKIGILGIKQVDENGEIHKSCARFPSFFSFIYRAFGLDRIISSIFKPHYLVEFDHNTNRVVDQVMGSFYMIRKENFFKVNGYDERFFVYYEDLDLALRIKEEGYISYFYADTYIYHKGAGTTESVKSFGLFINIQSKIKFIKKHFNRWESFILNILILTAEPISRWLYTLLKKGIKDSLEIIAAYKLIYKDILRND